MTQPTQGRLPVDPDYPPADVRDVLRLVELYPGSELQFNEKYGVVLVFPSDHPDKQGDHS